MDFFIAIWHIILAMLISSVALVPIYLFCGIPFILWGINARCKELKAMKHSEDTVPLEPAGFTVSGVAHVVRNVSADPLVFAQTTPNEGTRSILIAAYNKYVEMVNELRRSGRLTLRWEEHVMRTIREHLKIKGLLTTPEGQEFLNILRTDFTERIRR